MSIPFVILTIADDGDRAFMEALYRDNHRLMYAKAYGYVHSSHDADDIVNDACIALIGKISVIRQLSCNSLRAYIVTTVKNIALNRIRRVRNRRETEFDEEAINTIPTGDGQPEETVFDKAKIEAMLACIDRLSDRDQALLRMRYFLDMNDAEIAQALGVMPVSVRSGLSRARARVYQMLREGTPNE